MIEYKPIQQKLCRYKKEIAVLYLLHKRATELRE